MTVTAELPDTPWRDEVFASQQSKPAQGGTIRTTPESFLVTEDLGYGLSGSGEHCFLDITKRGANTGWVAEKIAEFAEVKPMDVGYAGRKDRHAVTRQWFSVYLPARNVDFEKMQIEGVTLHAASRHSRKLRPGEIKANHFEIHIEAPNLDQSEVSDRLSGIINGGFPNYFGPQRFGRGLHNLDAADRFLRQNGKPEGNRGMLLSAARSWLFNLYLSDQLRAGQLQAGDQGPLYGKSRDPQPGEENLGEVYLGWIQGLRRRGAKVGQRPLLVTPTNLEWEFVGGGLDVRFELPPGCYATSLMAEVLQIEDAAL